MKKIVIWGKHKKNYKIAVGGIKIVIRYGDWRGLCMKILMEWVGGRRGCNAVGGNENRN